MSALYNSFKPPELEVVAATAATYLEHAAAALPQAGGEVLRREEIDALSTLGPAAVSMLTAETDILGAWTDQDVQQLTRFSDWRMAAQVRARTTFPKLFPRGAKIPKHHYGYPQPNADEIASDILPETVVSHEGTLPILVTAPYAGSLTHLNHVYIDRKEAGREPEAGIADIIAAMRQDVAETSNWRLPTLVDVMHTAHRTPQTRAYFEERVFLKLLEMRQTLGRTAPILHLDIHGFEPGTPADAHDLMVGKGHNDAPATFKTDKSFSKLAKKLGYDTHCFDDVKRPGYDPEANKYFRNDGPGALTQRVRSLGALSITSIEIQINDVLRGPEHPDEAQALAASIGAFCTLWAKDHHGMRY